MGNRQTAEEFTKKDIDLLVNLSGKSETEINQWYEEFRAETKGNNRLNKKQFKSFYTKLKSNSKLDDLTEHIFRAFDIDHSGNFLHNIYLEKTRWLHPYFFNIGSVNFHEFLAAYIITNDGNSREKFLYAFEVFDINSNNQIEKKEARKILGIISEVLGISSAEAASITETVMLSFDTNQDKVLSKEEFIHGCLNDRTLAQLLDPFNIKWNSKKTSQ